MLRVKFPIGLADMADAFRHLRPDRTGTESLAWALGFEVRSSTEEAPSPRLHFDADQLGFRQERTSRDLSAPSQFRDERPTEDFNAALKIRQLIKPKPAIRLPRHIRKSQPLPDSPPGVSENPPPSPLLARRSLRAFLMDAVGDDLPDESIDIDEAVEQIARYQLDRPLPRRRRRGFRSGLQLWIDESSGMQPFQTDVEQMCMAVRQIVGPSYEGEFFFDSLSLDREGLLSDGGAIEPVKLKAGTNVLLLTDLGIGRPPLKYRATSNQWRSFARTLAARAARVVAVVPYGPGRWPGGLSKWIKIVCWNSSRSQPPVSSKEQVRLLARSLSIASQIDLALLREARRRLLPNSDAGLEADFLFSTMVSVSNPRAIVLRKEILNDLRSELANEPAELKRAFGFLRDYRKQGSSDSRMKFEEELIFQSIRHAFGDRRRVRESLSRMVRSLVESDSNPSLARWVLSCLPELPEWIHKLSEAHYLRTAAELRLGFNPADFDPRAIKGSNLWLLPKLTSVGIRVKGGGLEFHEPPESNEPVIEVPATNPRVIFIEAATGIRTPVRFKPSQPDTIKVPALPIELTTLAGARYQITGIQPNEQRPFPPGVKLIRALKGHEGVIGRIRWSPDGSTIASPSLDQTIGMWETASGKLIHKFEAHLHAVNCLCWSPDGALLASGGDDNVIKIWEASSARLIRNFAGHQGRVWDISWSPDGSTLASASGDGSIRLWSTEASQVLHTLKGHNLDVTSIAWSPDGSALASASWDGTIKLWDPSSGNLLSSFEGHTDRFTSIVFLPHGRQLVSAGLDRIIRVWDITTRKMTWTIEGHIGSIKGLAVSADGRCLASKGGSGDGSVRLWRCDTWETLAVIPEIASAEWSTGLDFHPDLPLLATVGSDIKGAGLERDSLVHLWELDYALLLGKASGAHTTAVHHATAKIVLLGESGVGKTGLGWRLAHGEFKEHPSTHGQQFWVLDQLGMRRPDGTECEAILWDLAGQPDYRLTHALFLDDADLALILFDPTDSRHPLHGVEFWLNQLKSGRPGSSGKQDDCPVILVGARADRGAARLTQEEIKEFCRQHGISGSYLATSAKEHIGLDDLLQRMKDQIPWDQKSATVTTITFKRIKDYVLGLKENPRQKQVIVSPQVLRNRLEKTDKQWEFTDAEMMTAVGHLSNYGYVRVLRTSKDEERILLTPELLNNLAASFVLEARRNPRGIGSLEEKRLLAGEYSFLELEKLSEEEQNILLDSAALLFLEHNICFRETDPLSAKSYLVFPELISLKKPLLDDEQETEDGVAYTVSGAIENVYASLVVLLGYTQTFTRTDQWRSHARYEVGDGLICGFRQDSEREGESDLVLYFGKNVGKPVRTLFQGIFESFLARRNLSVFRYEPVICSNGHVLNRAVVRNELRSGHTFAFCSDCGERVTLPKQDEPIQLTQTEQRKVDEQQWFAARRSRFEQAVFQVMSYVEDQKLKRPECFISYAWGDKDHERWVERNLATDLQKAGINVLLDRWENARTGASVPRFIERIEKSSHIIVIGTPLYRKKYENRDTSTGYAVAAEVDLISVRLIGGEHEKGTVLPVLLDGDEASSFPPLVQGRVYADFRNERAYFTTAFDLILDLYGIPHHHQAVADLRESLAEREMR